MSSRSAIYKDILKRYDQMQLEALFKRNQRRRELYLSFPRLEEIDTELSMLGLSVTKAVLEAPDKIEEMTAGLKIKQEKLNDEKQKILTDSGFPKTYLDIQYSCDKCNDSGYVNNEPCFCFTQKLIDAVYNKSKLTNILKDENFDNFEIEYYSKDVSEGEFLSPRENMQRNLSECINFTRSFKTKKDNLFLYGKTGLGKTYICNCIAKDLLDKGITVMYVTAPQLFREIEKERFGKDEDADDKDDYLDNILSVELLVIDDLGTEFGTVFTASQLYHIISTRLINKLPIIISTNLEIKDLSEKYSDRITSRLMGDFTTLKFIGEDIRAMKKFKKS